MRSRNCDVECTRELVEAVARQLATRTVRDTDFIPTNSIQQNDIIAIVQGGINKQITLDTLSDALNSWLGIDDIKEQIQSIGIEYNSTEYWDNKIGYIPKAGEILIYSDYQTILLNGHVIKVPGIKIGSGNAYVQDLAFVGQKESNELLEHINNTTVHITAAERAFWNNKINVDDNEEVDDNTETLIFNRN